MKDRVVWISYFLFNAGRWIFNCIMRKLKIKIQIGSLVQKKELMSVEEAHKNIKNIINQNKPALVARFGSNEAHCVAEAIGIKLGVKKSFSKFILQKIHFSAGLFPKGEKMSMRFSEISCDAAKQVDILGYWSSYMQDYLAKNVCSSNVKLTMLRALEPYNSDEPWSSALKGKKVVVIHPFKKTIEAQYAKREVLFDNPNVLPAFDLRVVQAVQTIAGEKDERFCDWEDALNYMYSEAMREPFDVAIIGCGAYGMPLAAKLKESGKIAIHLGGATQLLFGIKGARWDNHPLKRLYNEHWVRPLPEETPQASNKIEGACFW